MNHQATKPGLVLGDLCERYAIASWRVRHLLEVSNVEPAYRLGTVRVFSPEQLPALDATFKKIHGRNPPGVAAEA